MFHEFLIIILLLLYSNVISIVYYVFIILILYSYFYRIWIKGERWFEIKFKNNINISNSYNMIIRLNCFIALSNKLYRIIIINTEYISLYYSRKIWILYVTN